MTIDTSILRDWATALKGIADEIDTVANASQIVEAITPTPSVSTGHLPTSQGDATTYTRTLYVRKGFALEAMRKQVVHHFKHNMGLLRIVREPDYHEFIATDVTPALIFIESALAYVNNA